MTEREWTERLERCRARGARIGSMGKSLFGRDLPFLLWEGGRGVLLITAGIHAREYPTAEAALVMAEYAAGRLTPRGIGLCVAPCLNPDGAALCVGGPDTAPPERRAALRALNGGDDFRLWKANGRGVDLNVNFPARWGSGVSNVFAPAACNYVGPSPASEPETRALVRLSRRLEPLMTLSLHAKGREIYWEFGQTGARRARDRRLATAAARATGYRRVDGTLGSAGGYKDWCVETLGIPALTVEIGRDAAPHPLPAEELSAELLRLTPLAAVLLRELEGK